MYNIFHHIISTNLHVESIVLNLLSHIIITQHFQLGNMGVWLSKFPWTYDQISHCGIVAYNSYVDHHVESADCGIVHCGQCEL